MSVDNMTDDEFKAQETQLLAALQDLGGDSGNITLQRKLGWGDDTYWPIRDRLVNAGLIEKRRGRGGAVKLIQASEDQTVETQPTAGETEKELDLYEPIAGVLRGDWQNDNRVNQCLVEVTAYQGRRKTGGKWTRPDLVALTLRILPFVPGKHFDLVSFEVKPKWSLNVEGVFEALAHRAFATQAFAWYHCTEEQRSTQEDALSRITAVAERHGVGVILAGDPKDYSTWDTVVQAERDDSDPEKVNDFISRSMSAAVKEKLREWVR